MESSPYSKIKINILYSKEHTMIKEFVIVAVDLLKLLFSLLFFWRWYKGICFYNWFEGWSVAKYQFYFDEKILEKIKKLKGIYYYPYTSASKNRFFIGLRKGLYYCYPNTSESGKRLFIIPEKLSNKAIEKIFYWTQFYGNWSLAAYLFYFMQACYPEKKKLIKKEGNIRGRGVFCGRISPRFWLRWEALYHILDKKKAYDGDLLSIRGLIDYYIQSQFGNYIFEVGERYSASLVYEFPFNPNASEIYFKPKYSTIFEVLEEARNKINSYVKERFGIELRTLYHAEFGPIDKPNLGLWKLDKKEEKLKEEIFKQVFLKTKESQIDSREDSIEFFNEEISIKPQKIPRSELIKPEEIRIDFYNSEIPTIIPPAIEEKVITKKREASPQIFSLLKCHLEHHYQQKEGIHWMHGFIIFPAWRKREEKMDYLEAFSISHSFLKRLGKNTKLWTIKERKVGQGDRYKKGHWTLENISFYSNIFDAWERCKKAKELEKNGNFSEAKQMLVESCNIYPDYLEGHLLLLGCYKKEEFKNLEDKEIKKMLKFFEKKKNEYDAALRVIKNLRQNREDNYWKKLDEDAKETIMEIEAAYKKFESIETDLSKRCEDRKVFTPEEKEWERLKDLIIDAVDKKDEDSFKELIVHPAIIKKVIKIVKYKISVDFHDFEEKNIERRVVSHFYDEIKKVEIADFSTLKYFNGYLRKALYHSVKKEILEEKGVENVEEIMKEIIGKKGKGLQGEEYLQNDFPEDHSQY